MNSIIKWSQNVKLSVALFVIALVLLILQPQTFSYQQIISIGVLIITLLVAWGLSRGMKFQNANISSALFIIGVTSILQSLSNLFSGPLFIVSAILGITSFLALIIFSKKIYQVGWGRTIWFLILSGFVFSILTFLSAQVFGLEKSTKFLERLNEEKQSNQEKVPVDPIKLQRAKTMFPKGFPLPNDQVITGASVIEGKKSTDPDGFNFPAVTIISYVTQEDIQQITKTYTEALKAQGLTVNTGEKDNDEIIKGYKTKVWGNTNVMDGTYNISVYIHTLPNGSKEVGLSITE